jgi:hypothetical protein
LAPKEFAAKRITWVKKLVYSFGSILVEKMDLKMPVLLKILLFVTKFDYNKGFHEKRQGFLKKIGDCNVDPWAPCYKKPSPCSCHLCIIVTAYLCSLVVYKLVLPTSIE